MKDRTYNVVSRITKVAMVNYGKTTQLNATPMTHSQACTFKSKMTPYDWAEVYLVEHTT